MRSNTFLHVCFNLQRHWFTGCYGTDNLAQNDLIVVDFCFQFTEFTLA